MKDKLPRGSESTLESKDTSDFQNDSFSFPHPPSFAYVLGEDKAVSFIA